MGRGKEEFFVSTDKFEGFSAPSSHTQTPNEFFDEILLSKGITIAEVKIVGFMIRNTFGWNRQGNSLKFTFTEIMKAVCLAREATNNGLKKCLDKGYIQRKEVNGELCYRLNIKDYEDYPWNLMFEWKKVNKNLKKWRFENRTNDVSSEIEPVAVRKSNQKQFGNRTDFEAKSLDTTKLEDSLNTVLNTSLNTLSSSSKNYSDPASFYETEIDKEASIHLLTKLQTLGRKYTNLLVIQACIRCAEANARYPYKFIETVSSKWFEAGCRTEEDILRYEDDFRKQKKEKKPRRGAAPVRKELTPGWLEEERKQHESDQQEDIDYDAMRKKIEERRKRMAVKS